LTCTSQKPPKQRFVQHCAFVVQLSPVGVHVPPAPPAPALPPAPVGGGGTHFPATQLKVQQSAFVVHTPVSAVHGVVHKEFWQMP
jgi:hypothetical protein